MDPIKAEAWKRVDAATYADTHKKTVELYTGWASKYDDDLDALNYVTPKHVTTEVLKYIKNDPETIILDVAAGTGKCGEELKKLKFQGAVDALEINSALLNVAKSKALYRNHIECGVFEDKQLPVPDLSFDAVIVAGSMGPNHIEPGCAHQMVRPLKKGGIIICTVRATDPAAEYRRKLEGHLEDLVRGGTMEKVEVKELSHYETNCRETGTVMNNKVYIYRKL